MSYLNYELNHGEKFLMIIRKHSIFLVFSLIKAIISIVIALILSTKFADFQYADIIAIAWIITSIIYGVYKAVVWHLDCFIITDKRIIDINQKNLFSRIVSEVGVGNIEEAIYEINGILATILNYGTVKIKIANNGGMVGMERIPNPKTARDLIAEIQKT